MIAVALLALGLFLSAFFSGSETGFYRVTRVRLLMDAKSGNLIAKSLLWLVARPTIVVATVLIGNNIANYLVSFGLVLASQSLFAESGSSLQTFLPVLATPFLFIYGELLPKYLYYNAPYFLSTRGAPLMVLCAGVFLPISAVVIALESLWHRVLGSEHTRAKFSLERQELQRVMMEGQEAGILLPVQRELSQNLFTYGSRPIRQFTVPIRAIPCIPWPAEGTAPISRVTRDRAFETAKGYRNRFVAVMDETNSQLAGFLSVSDVVLFENEVQLLPVYRAKPNESSIHVLTQMQSMGSLVAQVEGPSGNLLGVVPRERLVALLVNE